MALSPEGLRVIDENELSVRQHDLRAGLLVLETWLDTYGTVTELRPVAAAIIVALYRNGLGGA